MQGSLPALVLVPVTQFSQSDKTLRQTCSGPEACHPIVDATRQPSAVGAPVQRLAVAQRVLGGILG